MVLDQAAGNTSFTGNRTKNIPRSCLLILTYINKETYHTVFSTCITKSSTSTLLSSSPSAIRRNAAARSSVVYLLSQLLLIMRIYGLRLSSVDLPANLSSKILVRFDIGNIIQGRDLFCNNLRTTITLDIFQLIKLTAGDKCEALPFLPARPVLPIRCT